MQSPPACVIAPANLKVDSGFVVETRIMERCPWCESFDLYRHYHDTEWGVPLYDDPALFELLTLEGAQAGLSWSMILKKREHYREVFDGFDPCRIAQYGRRKSRGVTGRSGDRAQPRQGRGDHRQRQGLPGTDRKQPEFQ